NRGDGHDDDLEQLAGPARVDDQDRDQQQWSADREGAAVDDDEAVRGHGARTAAASSRTRRSAAPRPSWPRASTIALPTTTPSARAAVARACAGVPIPKPTARGAGSRRVPGRRAV